MPIPKLHEITGPAIQFFRDGQSHRIVEVYEELAKHFHLTEEEQNEMLPSGTQRRWHNRADWACYELFRAELLTRPQRGAYMITDLGRKVAEENPPAIDRDYLHKFPSFVKFIEPKNKKDRANKEDISNTDEIVTGESRAPQETIETAYKALHADLKIQLLALVKKMDPFRFEHLVVDLLVAMGYGGSREEAAKVTKASNDEGIDGVINEDRLGLDVVYIQAKRWQGNVGRKEIQSFVGALAGQQAHKGVFITTSDFVDTAIAYAKSIPQKVVLIDGDRLADLMIEHNIGVALSHAYTLKRIDSDYFEES
jgi:restriction system protein